jgi:hypothetical protein
LSELIGQLRNGRDERLVQGDLSDLFSPSSHLIGRLVKYGVTDYFSLSMLIDDTQCATLHTQAEASLTAMERIVFGNVLRASNIIVHQLKAAQPLASRSAHRSHDSLARGLASWFTANEVQHSHLLALRAKFLAGSNEEPSLLVETAISRDRRNHTIFCAACPRVHTLSLGLNGTDLSSLKKHLIGLNGKKRALDSGGAAGSGGAVPTVEGSEASSPAKRVQTSLRDYHFLVTLLAFSS